jgi:hypothetical protein
MYHKVLHYCKLCCCLQMLNQGTLTEGEGSVRLTSSLRQRRQDTQHNDTQHNGNGYDTQHK